MSKNTNYQQGLGKSSANEFIWLLVDGNIFNDPRPEATSKDISFSKILMFNNWTLAACNCKADDTGWHIYDYKTKNFEEITSITIGEETFLKNSGNFNFDELQSLIDENGEFKINSYTVKINKK